MGIRKLWNKYAVYAGLIGLIVDIIALLSILGIRIQNRSPIIIPIPISFFIRYSNSKFLLAVSLSLIVFSYGSLLLSLPRSRWWRGSVDARQKGTGEPKEVWITTHASIDSLFAATAIISPAILLWMYIFMEWPDSNYLFVTLFTALIMLAFLFGLDLIIQGIRFKPIWMSNCLMASLTVFVVSYSFTDWSLFWSIVISILLVSLGVAYIQLTFHYSSWLYKLKEIFRYRRWIENIIDWLLDRANDVYRFEYCLDLGPCITKIKSGVRQKYSVNTVNIKQWELRNRSNSFFVDLVIEMPEKSLQRHIQADEDGGNIKFFKPTNVQQSERKTKTIEP